MKVTLRCKSLAHVSNGEDNCFHKITTLHEYNIQSRQDEQKTPQWECPISVSRAVDRQSCADMRRLRFMRSYRGDRLCASSGGALTIMRHGHSPTHQPLPHFSSITVTISLQVLTLETSLSSTNALPSSQH